MRAWLFQDHRQKQKLGDKAPWSVGWMDPEGKKRSKRIGSKSNAEKFKRKTEGELAAGLCHAGPAVVSWKRFREEYESTVASRWRSSASRTDATRCFDLFEKVAKPRNVSQIADKTLDQYAAKRLTMKGKRDGDTTSPETVRKELRTIRAALNVAVRWKYLNARPAMPSIDGYGKEKAYLTEAHFDNIMEHCNWANLPRDQHYSAEVFWKALLATAWVTGMRKSALLAITWDDVDLDAGVVISRHQDNKQKRDQRHIITGAVPFLRPLFDLRQFGETRVFPWNHAIKSLDRDFERIQTAAEVHLHCAEKHAHTPSCHLYGFHAFRYAHATYNFGRVPDRQLQEQMGHASFNTTLRYIKYAEEQQREAYDAHLPKSLQKSNAS